jgi:hypothetical protein
MRAVICSAILLAALAAPFAASAQPAQTPAAPSSKIPSTLPADVAFARQLAFLRADLLIADALVKERDWVDARPHAEFTREEVYGVIREDLRTYKVPAFDGALRELAGAIRARNLKAYERAREKVRASLAVADKALRARQPDWTRFTLQVAVATLSRAPEEYDDAVADGRIRRAVGYQTVRGLVLEAAQMIDGLGEALGAKDPQAIEELRASLSQLKSTFGPLAAPKQAPVEPATVKSLVARIEAAANRL